MRAVTPPKAYLTLSHLLALYSGAIFLSLLLIARGM